MGITIAYRGRLADLSRIEDFEDRLVDFALEVGGLAQIWRSAADDDPQRMVRGVILNLAPGQESASLLVSPEGWLIGLVDIKDAERGRLTEPPWCFIKTQFGPLEGHVALVEMFAALQREFLTDLEVSDEGGYWETRNLAELSRKRSLLTEAIDALAEGLERHGLSREAAEDSDILVKRIERIAAQVHRILQRPAEHPPVTFPDDEATGVGQDPEATEALWDELYKHNRRQQERMQRALEERRSGGEDDEEAFEKALEELGLDVPDEEPGPEEESWDDEERQPFPGTDEAGPIDGEEQGDPFEAEEDRHSLLKDAMDLLKRLHTLFRGTDPRLASSLRTLYQGAGDAMGGLAQALSRRGDEEDDADDYGLRITQLKRALRGTAFARGALFPLRPAVTAEQFEELYQTLGRLEQDIFHEIGRLRSERQTDES
jgi:cytochrome c556